MVPDGSRRGLFLVVVRLIFLTFTCLLGFIGVDPGPGTGSEAWCSLLVDSDSNPDPGPDPDLDSERWVLELLFEDDSV